MNYNLRFVSRARWAARVAPCLWSLWSFALTAVRRFSKVRIRDPKGVSGDNGSCSGRFNVRPAVKLKRTQGLVGLRTRARRGDAIVLLLSVVCGAAFAPRLLRAQSAVIAERG